MTETNNEQPLSKERFESWFDREVTEIRTLLNGGFDEHFFVEYKGIEAPFKQIKNLPKNQQVDVVGNIAETIKSTFESFETCCNEIMKLLIKEILNWDKESQSAALKKIAEKNVLYFDKISLVFGFDTVTAEMIPYLSEEQQIIAMEYIFQLAKTYPSHLSLSSEKIIGCLSYLPINNQIRMTEESIKLTKSLRCRDDDRRDSIMPEIASQLLYLVEHFDEINDKNKLNNIVNMFIEQVNFKPNNDKLNDLAKSIKGRLNLENLKCSANEEGCKSFSFGMKK
jgi:hypothetical protein